MLTTAFLDEILSILKNTPESYSHPHVVLQTINARDEESKVFLRLLIDCMEEWALPISYEDTPSFIQIYKNKFDHKEEFEYLALHTDHAYLKAVVSEMLWAVERKLTHAETAIHAYMQLYPYKKDDGHKGCEVLCSVCRICSKCRGITFDSELFWEMCAEYIARYRDTEGYCALFILEGLLECNIKPQETELVLTDSITHFEQLQIYDKAISYRNDLILLRKKNNHPNPQLHADNACSYEKQALMLDASNTAHIIQIVELIHKAMAEWELSKTADFKQNRERLARFLNPVKGSLIKNMAHVSSPPIDISNIVQSIKDHVSNSSFEETLLQISRSIRLQGFAYFQERKQSIFADLFPERILDSKGRVIADLPSRMNASNEDQRKIAQHDACKYYRDIAQICIGNYLSISKSKFSFTEDTLRFLVDHNMFIPADRRSTFLKGIVAGFSGDWSTAMHLLMPQVENAIRCLAEDCDIVTYKTKQSGIEECKSLSTILSSPELKEYLEDDLIFNMEVFYTSEYGFGMRDQISHGLFSDTELNSFNSMAVWCFTLYLCCIYCPELAQRLNKKHSESVQEPR